MLRKDFVKPLNQPKQFKKYDIELTHPMLFACHKIDFPNVFFSSGFRVCTFDKLGRNGDFS